MKAYSYLIALDLDGTSVVYNPRLEMEPELISYLTFAGRRGVGWVMNSDRYTDTMAEIAGLLPIGQKPAGLLSCQRYIHLLDHEAGYLPAHLWNQQQDQCHRILWEQLRPFFTQWSSQVEAHFTIRDRVINDLIFAYMVPPEQSPELRRLMRQFVLEWPLAQVSGNHDWTFILHASFSKARVLKKSAELMGIPLDHVIAIGDGINDIPMLDGSVTGLVGCPCNAAPEVVQTVKKAGGMVAGAAEAAGTLEILRYYLGRLL